MDTVDPVIQSQVSTIAQGVRRRLAERRTIASTYRLQFHSDFTFRDAATLAGYFADLGVSHVYSSPQSVARPGSRHGYDVVDPQRLNPELGTPEEAAAFQRALIEHGLGQIVDIVPNHMSVATSDNAWWMDVLTHGPASRFAHYFDIDWQPLREELTAGVLLPILGDLYGRTLEAGQLVLRFQEGAFWVDCPGIRLPLDPKTWTVILEEALPASETPTQEPSAEDLEFRSILSALSHLPERTASTDEARAERFRETIVIQGRLKRLIDASPNLTDRFDQILARINGTPGEPATFDRLHALLEAQVYHLVHWKAGSDELNYRRFFDVTELAAICTEHRDVFEATHQRWLAAAAAEQIDGLRIDHIDGLFDPAEYLWRLQVGYLRDLVRDECGRARQQGGQGDGDRPEGGADLDALEAEVLAAVARDFLPLEGMPDRMTSLVDPNASPAGPGFRLWPPPRDNEAEDRRGTGAGAEKEKATDPSTPRGVALPVFVEKILGRGETLPESWPVLGTTGYEFLSQANGLFVSPGGLRELEKHYVRSGKVSQSLPEVIYQSKRLILSGPMQSEIQLLARRLDRLSSFHRGSRDYTLLAIRAVLREVVACFPVYRTYITAGAVVEADREIIARAVAEARRRNPMLDQELFGFLRDVLFLERPPLDAAGEVERAQFVGRFQQVTGPVAAKGVEDTTFYRHIPLTSLSEVGVDLRNPLTSVAEFHEQTLERQRHWPASMLATTTHDTKRTEDVRARINVLSEIPGQWRTTVERWFRWNRKYRAEVDGEPAPSRNDEWLFYQTLVGIWPLEPPTAEGWKALTQRLLDYMQKATHEAKLHTSWINPNAPYDEAVAFFIRKVLEDPAGRFLSDVAAFAESIIDRGLYNSCSQVLLKLMSPGTPDVYQGQEIWDFSLVDPDNRRPVDYELRRGLLADLRSLENAPEGRLALACNLARHPRDPRFKLFITSTALHWRKRCTVTDDYRPVDVQGPLADHVCAFRRSVHGSGQQVVVVVPRLIAGLTATSPPREAIPCGPLWGETAIDVRGHGPPTWTNAFTGEILSAAQGELRLAEVLREFPVALLSSEPNGRA